jgi:hypothetical protein
VFFALVLSGCSRSVRKEAKPIAQYGSITAGQIAEIYRVAQQDVTDTFGLDQFYTAYADPTATVALSDEDKEEFEIMQQTNRALESRVRLARAMKDVYESYGRFADYNNAAEMEKSAGELVSALNTAAAFTLAPTAASPAASAVGETAGSLLKAIASEVGTIKQNRALIREGKRLIPLLERLRLIFDEERKLLATESLFQGIDENGSPQVDAQGKPVLVPVRGIAGERVQAYKRLHLTCSR